MINMFRRLLGLHTWTRWAHFSKFMQSRECRGCGAVESREMTMTPSGESSWAWPQVSKTVRCEGRK